MSELKYKLNLTDEQFTVLEEAASLMVLKHQFIESMEDAVARLASNYIGANGGLLHLNKKDDWPGSNGTSGHQMNFAV